jgi:hypothetical protein
MPQEGTIERSHISGAGEESHCGHLILDDKQK